MPKKEEPTVKADELDAAAAEAEPATEPDTEGEKTDEEKMAELEAAEAEEARLKEEEHKERSALGRKVKDLTDKFDGLDTKLDQLLAGATKEEPEYDEDFVPTTKKELDEYLKNWRQKEIEGEQKYQENYMVSLSKYKEEDDHDEIIKELNENFNFKHSDNGALDAEINYLKASRAYYKKKISGTKPAMPLKGESPKAPLGPGSEGEPETETEPVMPELDEDARDFLSRIKRQDYLDGKKEGERGLTDEAIKDAFKEDLPPGLTGGKLKRL